MTPDPPDPLTRLPTMFLGHYGVAMALKRAEPKLSLGTLFLAVQLADLLWGIFMLLGWEHARIIPGYTAVTPIEFLDYPISHSLVAAVAWGIVAAAAYYSWPTRDTTRHWQAAAIVGVAVFSHYPLDVLVHVPDLPIYGDDSAKLGLGLWNNPTATNIAEFLVFGIGLGLYVTLKSHRHPVRIGPARHRLRSCSSAPIWPASTGLAIQHDYHCGERYRLHSGSRRARRVGRPAGDPPGVASPAPLPTMRPWTGSSLARCPLRPDLGGGRRVWGPRAPRGG